MSPRKKNPKENQMNFFTLLESSSPESSDNSSEKKKKSRSVRFKTRAITSNSSEESSPPQESMFSMFDSKAPQSDVSSEPVVPEHESALSPNSSSPSRPPESHSTRHPSREQRPRRSSYQTVSREPVSLGSYLESSLRESDEQGQNQPEEKQTQPLQPPASSSESQPRYTEESSSQVTSFGAVPHSSSRPPSREHHRPPTRESVTRAVSETTPPASVLGAGSTSGGGSKSGALKELKAIQERLSRALAERTTSETRPVRQISSPPKREEPSLPQKLIEQSPWKSPRVTTLEQKKNDDDVLTVRELYRRVNPVLKEFGSVRIKGEVSNRKIPGSRHMYFSLKDDGGVINMAFFRQYHKPNQFLPQNGMEVVCRGQVAVYESRSNFQMIVHEIEPIGVGALFEAFERLKGRLTQEGLFDISRKKPIPAYPRRIGLVTSPTGAALRDMLKVFRRRSPSISLLLAGSQVQGEGAALQVAAAIEALNRQDDLDLIIVGRGGGSMEDLWAFNEEPVVRAIAASRYPVISGVGHETDTTLSDLVADLRAPTPSAAAERASRNADADMLANFSYFEERLEDLASQKLQDLQVELLQLNRRLGSPERRIVEAQRQNEQILFRMQAALKKQVEGLGEQLQRQEKRLEQSNPVSQVHQFRQRWIKATQGLESHHHKQMEQFRHRFAHILGRLHDLSPLNVLKRGYTLAYDEQGAVLQNSEQVEIGDKVTLQLREGQLEARVEAKRSEEWK